MPGTTRAGPLPTSRPPRGAVLPGAPRRPLGALLDRPWAVLVAWQVVLVAWQPRGGMAWLISWHYVITGVHAITGPFGLALYARHPELQMGPLTFLLSAPFVQLGRPADELAATAAMEALGLLAVAVLGGFVDRTTRADRIRWLLTGFGVLLGWHLLAVAFGHPDDALALLGVVLGLRCLRSGAPLRAALALGLAIDCKPWVVPVVVVLAGAPRGSRLRAAAVLAATVAVVWLPFVIQPGAIEHVSRFTIVVAPTSTIHLLGLAGPRTPPWCRPAQLLVGAAAVAVLTARRRPEAALLAVVAVRLLLDPGAHGYYEAGLLLGTALLDLRARLPIATAIAILGVHLPPDLLSHAVPAQAVLRAAALVLVLLLALVVPLRGDAGEAPPLRRSRGPEPPLAERSDAPGSIDAAFRQEAHVSGHSKWATTKHQKAVKDQRRAKSFAKLIKNIEVAAKMGGADLSGNPTLVDAVQKAKKTSVPNDNIDRAIKRGAGLTGETINYDTIMYEGYGPNGVALLIECLTDNRNRAAAEVRTAMSRNGGTMADPGSVAYNFSRKGVIRVAKADGLSEDDVLGAVLDAGVEDVADHGEEFEVVTEPSDLVTARTALQGAGIDYESADSEFVPGVTIEIDDVDVAKKILKLVDALEDSDDVQNVFANFDFSDEVSSALDEDE